MSGAAPDLTIRSATVADAPDICRIYNPFILDSIVTFEQVPVSEQEMAERISRTMKEYPWLVACAARNAGAPDRVIGYAYGSRWRTRAAYDRTVETTVYLERGCERAGAGRALYAALLSELRARGFHTAIGGISLPNPASVGFHEAMGFRKVALYREVGNKFDQWIDVGFWQLFLKEPDAPR